DTALPQQVSDRQPGRTRPHHHHRGRVARHRHPSVEPEHPAGAYPAHTTESVSHSAVHTTRAGACRSLASRPPGTESPMSSEMTGEDAADVALAFRLAV